MTSIETFTFIDKETGDLIPTGSANDFSLAATTTRAMEFAPAPIGVFEGFGSSSFISSSQFAPEYTPTEFFNSKEVPTQKKEKIFVVETISPCPRKPRMVSPSHFYVPHPTFIGLSDDINSCLKNRPELVYSSVPKKSLWKCKYLEGSQTREMHVQCYWDASKKSHLVDIKRVHGDGLFPHHLDLTTILKTDLGVPPASTNNVARGLPPRLSPAMMARRSDDLAGESQVRTPERFRESLQAVFDMSKHNFNEPRLDASKMLCDIIARQPVELLEAPIVQTDILETINTFLQDQYESVVEFGVVAAHALLEKSAEYRSVAIGYKSGSILSSLIAQIRNAEYNEETGEDDFYMYAQMRRLAGKALSLLVKNVCDNCVCPSTHIARQQLRVFMSRILQQSGFFTQEDWREYISCLQDDQLRGIVLAVADCYC